MHRTTTVLLTASTLALSLGAAAALAANVTGTARADTLRGTAKADRISGRGGNDRLMGLAGNDVLSGGPGNDVIVGGPGADTLSCGPGRDRAKADPADRVAADCEVVTGLPKPALSVDDLSAQEGNAGTTTVTFSVTLAQPTQLPVTVSFTTQDGTATAPEDYAAARGTLAFAPGETVKSVTVSVMGDDVAEPDEAFALLLSAPVNATLGKAAATATIANDDPRSGNYSGRTSQGRPISFTVAPGLRSLTDVRVRLDSTCQSPYGPVPIVDRDFSFGSLAIQIAPDRRFSFADRAVLTSGELAVSFAGGLALSGSAEGTIRLDMVLNTEIGRVPCTTGDVTWTAG